MIRSATKNDISRIAEILVFSKRSSYRDIFKNDKVSFNEIQVLPIATEFINNPKLLENRFVFDDEFVKGMIYIEIGDDIEIVELHVEPFFKNQSIGSKLISFIDDYACKLSITNIFLWVLEKNDIARKFYEKHGFTHNGERKLVDGTPEYILKYKKVL